MISFSLSNSPTQRETLFFFPPVRILQGLRRPEPGASAAAHHPTPRRRDRPPQQLSCWERNKSDGFGVLLQKGVLKARFSLFHGFVLGLLGEVRTPHLQLSEGPRDIRQFLRLEGSRNRQLASPA